MTTWKLDSAHTQVNFSAKHMMVTTVRGQFHDVQGTIELDETTPTRSHGEFTVATASVDTNFAARDTHLRSADFFDVATYPLLTFVSKTIAKHGDELQLLGALTIHGITRDITLEVEQLGATNDPWGNHRLAFSARGSLDRKDFGLHWNQVLEAGGFMVGDKIELSLDIEAVRAAAKVAA